MTSAAVLELVTVTAVETIGAFVSVTVPILELPPLTISGLRTTVSGAAGIVASPLTAKSISQFPAVMENEIESRAII